MAHLQNRITLGTIKVLFVALFGLCLIASNAAAAEIESTYTKLDLETDCQFDQTDDMGATAVCKGLNEQYPIHFAEGDLRQMVQFGILEKEAERWESFSRFNRINDTVEWRTRSAKPFATILRWFVHFEKEDGSTTEGQILVVSTVGTVDVPQSCIVGYVDALANKNANIIARNVADTISPDFDCNHDLPKYHGNKGPYSGNPSRLAE